MYYYSQLITNHMKRFLFASLLFCLAMLTVSPAFSSIPPDSIAPVEGITMDEYLACINSNMPEGLTAYFASTDADITPPPPPSTDGIMIPCVCNDDVVGGPTQVYIWIFCWSGHDCTVACNSACKYHGYCSGQNTLLF